MKRWWVICLALLLLLPAGCGEKERPEGELLLRCLVSGEGFTLTGAGGESLRREDGAFSGSMTMLEQEGADKKYTPSGHAQREHSLSVPYSESLTCRWDEAGSRLFFMTVYCDYGDGVGEPLQNYSVSGSRLAAAAITPQKEITATAEERSTVKVGFSLHCAVLKSSGRVSFTGRAAESISVRPDEENNCFSFSGFRPGSCVLSYSGAHSKPWVTIPLEVGSGTLDFSQAAKGTLILTEEGREARTISVE